jgi:beta-glucosidase
MVTSAQYLQRLLRDTLGFEGLTVTDWREIANLKDWHMTAATESDAVRLAMQRTSIDMSMVGRVRTLITPSWARPRFGTPQLSTRQPHLPPITPPPTHFVQVPYDMSFAEELLALVESGQVPEARVDAAVDRILTLKYKLGLLEHAPQCQPEGAWASRAPGHPDDRAEALQLVR